MVQAYILASANQYEEPRPPRRGSHRPETRSPLPVQTLNEYYNSYSPTSPYDSYYPTAFDAGFVGSYIHQHPEYFPSQDRHSGRSKSNSRALRPESPAIPITHPIRTAIDATVRPPLDLIRQLSGGVPLDPVSVEQSIRESYARSAPQSAACQSIQKRCMFPSCTKISVSRGLCRGHGGGRRCHVPGCIKSAQSRSNFCWAHGGGQRCDADQCMRSRKSKHFCVAHLHLENGSPTPSASDAESRRDSSPLTVKTPVALPVRALPSLGQALSSASRSKPNLPMRGSTRFQVHCA